MNEEKPKAWICKVCGYVHYGPEPPEVCPVCGSTKDFFEPHREPKPAAKVSPAGEWRCLNCRYVHEAAAPPGSCPVCGAPAERFETHSVSEEVAPRGGFKQRVVIAGAGIAGVSAAEALRTGSPDAEIVVLSSESRVPYYRLNLTRYLAGEIESAELELHPESWYVERGVRLELGAELRELDLHKKRIRLRDDSEEPFDRLILTMGSHPFVPPFAGADKENVTGLRTRDDAERIADACRRSFGFVCIGGGLLGLETAGALARQGVAVTLLEGHGWLLPRQLNELAGELLESFAVSQGISIRKLAKVREIVGDGRTRGVLLEDGSTVPADMVIIATGVRPNSYVARLAGLDVNLGIIVDNHLRSSHPDVFAAGDVAEHQGVTYGTWGPSQFQGTIAGMNVAGGEVEFAGIPRSNMLKVLGYDMFSIGQILPEDASVEVIDDEAEGSYSCFLFRDNRMVGSILLGDTSLSSSVKRVVEGRLDCSKILQMRPTAKDVLEFIREFK